MSPPNNKTTTSQSDSVILNICVLRNISVVLAEQPHHKAVSNLTADNIEVMQELLALGVGALFGTGVAAHHPFAGDLAEVLISLLKLLQHSQCEIILLAFQVVALVGLFLPFLQTR